jgi:16S rRNA (guanine966-N2)-methyltransferase
MRVIAGRYRSRALKAPRGMDTRPTSDRLRETLFNVVAPRTPDSVWLDLFAGSGAIGIEALSRGARHVYFVENDKKSVRAIRQNFEALGIDDGFEILMGDVVTALRALDQRQIACSVCFIDPPYAQHAAYIQTLTALAGSHLLVPDSWVIAEHDKHFDPGGQFGPLRRFRELKQGDAVLSFYQLASGGR